MDAVLLLSVTTLTFWTSFVTVIFFPKCSLRRRLICLIEYTGTSFGIYVISLVRIAINVFILLLRLCQPFTKLSEWFVFEHAKITSIWPWIICTLLTIPVRANSAYRWVSIHDAWPTINQLYGSASWLLKFQVVWLAKDILFILSIYRLYNKLF